jgi:SAM-dependent methyltransferase
VNPSALAHGEFLADHFARRLARHGPTLAALDWNDTASQLLRFRVLTGIGLAPGDRLLDVGCGLGDLLGYCAARGVAVEYVGIDPVPGMIAAARRRFPGVRFEAWDLLTVADGALPAVDYVVMSGLFNERGPDNEAFFRAMVGRAFAACRKGVAVNRLTDRVEFRAGHLAYSAPAEALAFALSLTRHVTLRHDYGLYEYSLYLRRDPMPCASA